MLYRRRGAPGASPKAVSGRTRYLRVCLAFHPYPRVVPRLFNAGGSGPPRGLTPASPCPRVAHPASRARPATVVARLGLAVAAARLLAWPRRRPWLAGSFFNRHAVTPLGRSGCSRARGFRRCFTPLPGCFSPFPRGTRPLSVTGECLALEGGPPCFPPGFTCPAVLWCGRRQPQARRVRGSNPVSRAFPCVFRLGWGFSLPPGPAGPGRARPQPRGGWARRPRRPPRFGLAPVRSPLLGGSRLISSPRGT